MTDLQTSIREAGGLHCRAGLAKRWGVSKAYVSEVTKRPDFPKPAITIDGKEYWAGNAADQWRSTPRKPGRPKAA